jgi:hypothetical protein
VFGCKPLSVYLGRARFPENSPRRRTAPLYKYPQIPLEHEIRNLTYFPAAKKAYPKK